MFAAEIVHNATPRVRTAGIALAAAAALAFPAHAFADAAPPAAPAASFSWNVQLAPNEWEGGVSPDLPSAIQTAEAGEALTPDQTAALVTAITAEATQAGASLVATTTPVTPPPAPAMPAVPADSGE